MINYDKNKKVMKVKVFSGNTLGGLEVELLKFQEEKSIDIKQIIFDKLDNDYFEMMIIYIEL
jgi:hypothetical protein